MNVGWKLSMDKKIPCVVPVQYGMDGSLVLSCVWYSSLLGHRRKRRAGNMDGCLNQQMEVYGWDFDIAWSSSPEIESSRRKLV